VPNGNQEKNKWERMLHKSLNSINIGGKKMGYPFQIWKVDFVKCKIET